MAHTPQNAPGADASALQGMLVVEFGARVGASAAGSLLPNWVRPWSSSKPRNPEILPNRSGPAVNSSQPAS